MAGYHKVATFGETFGSKIPYEGTIVPSVLPLAMLAATPATQPVGNEYGDSRRYHMGQGFCETAVKEHSQHTVAIVTAVDFVTMAEKERFAIQGDACRPFVDSCPYGIFEKRSHVEIVVPLKVDDGDPLFVDIPQPLQDREIVGERDLFIADPEFEEVSKDKKGIRAAWECGEKFHQQTVIFVCRVSKVGISYKDLAHCDNIYENQLKVKFKQKRIEQLADLQLKGGYWWL